MIAHYWGFARAYYVEDGRPTSEQGSIKSALRPLKQLYGNVRACDFGPLALKAVRKRTIGLGFCRNTINVHMGRIRRMFKWAVAEQVVSPTVYRALAAVLGLQRGRSEARETTRVTPIDEATVEVTLAHLPTVVSDMVRFQRLTGCRPGEVCILRPSDVDAAAEVWAWRPHSHKAQHHGRERVILIGPRAQKNSASVPERE